MKKVFFLNCALAFLGFTMGQESILTEQVLQISNVSAVLSALAYKNASDFAVLDTNGNITGYEHPDFEDIHFYTDEPDQGIVAEKDGRCYIAFRGTSQSLDDWEQNLNLGEVKIYKDNDNSTGEFCTAREGFAQFIGTPEIREATQDLLTCIETCSDPNDCVVITGHSQGGASSAVLSVLLYSTMPTVVTFGMPPTFKEGCTLTPERFYRFVNSRKEDDEEDDIAFDPVPFSPAFVSKSVHYGHYLLVGPDKTAAKYLGFDQNYTFKPTIGDRQNEIAAHTMNGTNYSYAARVADLLDTGNSGSFPVSTDGFTNGTICEAQYSVLCESGSCQNFACAPPVSELCVKGSCQEDSDCTSGVCIWDACTTADGEVAGGCPCGLDSQCKSGDCDTSLTSLDWTCVLGEGETAPPTGTPTSAGEHAYFGEFLCVAAMLGALFSWM